MAYARRTPGSKTRVSRGRAASKLQRAYRRKRVARPRSSVSKNARAIKTLDAKTHGHLQISYEVAAFDPTFVLSKSYPLAFCLNDFTSASSATGGNSTGGSIYAPKYVGTSPNITLGNETPGHFEKRLPGQINGLAPAYQQWRNENANTLNIFETNTSGGALNTSYMPVYAEYNFTFTRDVQEGNQPDIWIRFDEISPKKINNSFQVTVNQPRYTTMPTCLGALQDMANRNNPKQQNRYCPGLWHVKTRWVKLPGHDIGKSTPFVTHKMSMSFPKKELRLNPDRTVVSPFFEAFTNLCDRRDQKWLVVSVSNEPVAGVTTPIELNFTRCIKWRDSIGQRI